MILAHATDLSPMSAKELAHKMFLTDCHFPTAWEILFLANFMHHWWQEEMVAERSRPRLSQDPDTLRLRQRIKVARQNLAERHCKLVGMQGHPMWKPFFCLIPSSAGREVVRIDPTEPNDSIIKVVRADQVEIRRVLIMRYAD